MKKVAIFFLILLVLFIGVMIGSDPSYGRAGSIRDSTKEFENEIVIPGNNYENRNNVITPGINNKIAKSGGNIIKGIFSFSFDILKNIIE